MNLPYLEEVHVRVCRSGWFYCYQSSNVALVVKHWTNEGSKFRIHRIVNVCHVSHKHHQAWQALLSILCKCHEQSLKRSACPRLWICHLWDFRDLPIINENSEKQSRAKKQFAIINEEEVRSNNLYKTALCSFMSCINQAILACRKATMTMSAYARCAVLCHTVVYTLLFHQKKHYCITGISYLAQRNWSYSLHVFTPMRWPRRNCVKELDVCIAFRS